MPSMNRWVKWVMRVMVLWISMGRSVSRSRSLRVWAMWVGRESFCFLYSLVISDVRRFRKIHSNLLGRELARRRRRGLVRVTGVVHVA